MECLGSRLKQERQRLGLTQAMLATIGGVAPNAQGHYESGKRWPKADYLQSVSAAGVNIGYLINGPACSLDAPLCVPHFDSDESQPQNVTSDQFVNELLDKLGQSLWTTAATIAAIATMANLSDAASNQMADDLRNFHSESKRFVALACDLHHKAQLSK